MITSEPNGICNFEYSREDIEIIREGSDENDGQVSIKFINLDETISSQDWFQWSDNDIHRVAQYLYSQGSTIMNFEPLIHKEYVKAIKDGGAVILSDATFNKICLNFNSNVASIRNPNQIGTKDSLLVGQKRALRKAIPEIMAKKENRYPGVTFHRIMGDVDEHKFFKNIIDCINKADFCGMPSDYLDSQPLIEVSALNSTVLRVGPIMDGTPNGKAFADLYFKQGLTRGLIDSLVVRRSTMNSNSNAELINGLSGDEIRDILKYSGTEISNDDANAWLSIQPLEKLKPLHLGEAIDILKELVLLIDLDGNRGDVLLLNQEVNKSRRLIERYDDQYQSEVNDNLTITVSELHAAENYAIIKSKNKDLSVLLNDECKTKSKPISESLMESATELRLKSQEYDRRANTIEAASKIALTQESQIHQEKAAKKVKKSKSPEFC